MPVATKAHPPSVVASANLHLVNDPTSFVADAVSVSFELFVRLFPNTQRDGVSEASFYILVRFVGVPDFFRKFKLYRITSIDDAAPTPALLTLTNHSNLLEFGNDLTISSCVVQSVNADDIRPLTKLFVEVPDGVYAVLQQLPADAAKARVLASVSPGRIVSNGDTIRQLNGRVRLCEPFYQGLVTEDTDIVFFKATETRAPRAREHFDVDLSLYLAKSVSDVGLSRQMRVGALPHRIAVEMPSLFASEDKEWYAFVSTSDLLQIGFPVFNGDLVSVDTGKQRLVIKIFTLLEPNRQFEPGVVYFSPVFLINAGLTEASTVTLHPCAVASQLLADAVPIAKSATLSRVASPITMDKTYQHSFFGELKATFEACSRIVKKGDYVPVCVDTLLARAMADTVSQDEDAPTFVPKGNFDAVAWFKVVELEGKDGAESSQFRIDPTQTAMSSSGVEFVRAPPNAFANWQRYFDLPPSFDYEHAIAASGHFKWAAEFAKVMRTSVETSGKVGVHTTVLLNSMSRGLGKTTLVRSTALALGLNLIELDALDFVRPGAEGKSIGLLCGKIDKQLNGQAEADHVSSYHILYIKHLEALCVLADPNEPNASSTTSLSLKVVQTLQSYLKNHQNMALVASTNNLDKLSDNFRQIVKFQIDVAVPTEQERLEIFKFLLGNEMRDSNQEPVPEAFEDKAGFESRFEVAACRYDQRQDVSFQTLALQSAGLTPGDLLSIVRKAKRLAVRRLMALASTHKTLLEKIVKVCDGGVVVLVPEDFEKAINEARNEFSDSIGAPRIPNVKWEDIGGLDLVKDEILDTIDMPLKHPELFSNGLKKRSGILFYGPPGTGKTLLAKAIATNFSLNFFSVKGPELLNMYIGESEANVRRVFQKARDAKPCVIFFDELDSVAPKRGNQGDSGGVMDRIVSQLLAELDGMSGGESLGDGVFVVGATNRPDLLDEALLRPGRFDKMLYLGISDTDDKQTKILEALTRKFRLSDEVDLAAIAEKCSFTLTGADFYALCSDSMLNAMTRTAHAVDSKLKALNEQRKELGEKEVSSRWWFDNVATPEDIAVLVTMADFAKAQGELVPSVSAEELEHYLRVKHTFEGGK